jgi:hypothetical protein
VEIDGYDRDVGAAFGQAGDTGLELGELFRLTAGAFGEEDEDLALSRVEDWRGNPFWSKYSCGFPMVIFQQPTQSFFTADWSVNTIHCFRGDWK